jgi:hypothetical protein
MPSYIICSNDRDDLGHIHGLNLCPYFPTTSATIQVQSLNTQANFQILTDKDSIEFLTDYGDHLLTLNLGPQQGLSYDSVPALLNTYIVRIGQLFTAMFDNTHRVVFINKNEFQISSMTYNFRVLLGYQGVELPIRSHDKTMWVSRKSSENAQPRITGAEWIYPTYGQNHTATEFYQCRSPDRFTNCVFPIKISPEGLWDYRISYALSFDDGFDPFCTILPETGTATLEKGGFNGHGGAMKCTVTAYVFEGRSDGPSFKLKTLFWSIPRFKQGLGPPNPQNTVPYVKLIGKTRLVFGEATRVAVVPVDASPDPLTEIQVTRWETNDADMICFYGNHGDESREDENNSILVQAGYRLTAGGPRAEVRCYLKWWEGSVMPPFYGKWMDDGSLSARLEFEIVSDQVPVIRQEISPPMVGSGISTTELYLLSNCGTQSYRNSLGSEELDPAQVSAIISNAFSPGLPVQSSADIIARIPTSSLSNLWFRLVDANFVPIRLLNPLYLTLAVNPVADDFEDLTSFIGKLPKDRPTPEQAQAIAKQQAEEAQAQEEQKQTSGIVQEVISGLVQQYKDQKAREAQAQALAQAQAMALAQERQREAEALLLLQGQPLPPAPPPAPPPPTPEQVAEAQAQEQAEEREAILELEADPIS